MKFRINVTRDITESATIEVEAENVEAAAERALFFADTGSVLDWTEPYPLPHAVLQTNHDGTPCDWRVDDCSEGDAYIPDDREPGEVLESDGTWTAAPALDRGK